MPLANERIRSMLCSEIDELRGVLAGIKIAVNDLHSYINMMENTHRDADSNRDIAHDARARITQIVETAERVL